MLWPVEPLVIFLFGTFVAAFITAAVGVATFLMTLIALGGSGSVTANAAQLFLFGLPALALGTWAGWQFCGKTNEARFRQAVLILLLLSGLAPIAKA